jgi:hypothetical protein
VDESENIESDDVRHSMANAVRKREQVAMENRINGKSK